MEPKTILWALAAVNFAAFLYGVCFYYSGQLARTSPLCWVFVIDCPLYALLAGIVFFTATASKLPQWLAFVSSAGALKYGIWTVFAILFYSEYFLSPANRLLYAGLLGAHVWLALEGLWLAGTARVSRTVFAASLAWFLFGDFMDYAGGTHIVLPAGAEKLAAVAFASFALSVACTALVYAASLRKLDALAFATQLRGARKRVISSLKGT